MPIQSRTDATGCERHGRSGWVGHIIIPEGLDIPSHSPHDMGVLFSRSCHYALVSTPHCLNATTRIAIICCCTSVHVVPFKSCTPLQVRITFPSPPPSSTDKGSNCVQTRMLNRRHRPSTHHHCHVPSNRHRMPGRRGRRHNLDWCAIMRVTQFPSIYYVTAARCRLATPTHHSGQALTAGPTQCVSSSHHERVPPISHNRV